MEAWGVNDPAPGPFPAPTVRTENDDVFTRRAFSMSAAAALFARGGSARAQSTVQGSFATQNIRLVVGYPAGGGVDIVARLLTEPMKAAFGQAVLVENKPGAAAMIAAQSVARATADGHTLLVSAAGEVAVNQHIYKEKMTYDPLRELTPVALAGIVPCVVVVAATTPVKTPAELVAYALANKGKLSFSSSGVGNPQHLAGELMNRMAGTDVLHVPYRGSAPAVTDVAVGAVTMSFSSLAAALPLIQDGRLRAVAVTSRERMPQLPDVAPLSEGSPSLAGYELLNWFGVFAPSATPEPLQARLFEVISAALQDKATMEKLAIQGIVPRPMTLAGLRDFVRSESEKFGKIAEAAKIRAE